MWAGGVVEGLGGWHESRVMNGIIGNDGDSGIGWEGGTRTE